MKTSKKKWDWGILPSFGILVSEILVWILLFVLSYRAEGQAGLWLGLLGLAEFAAAITGIVISTKAVRRRSEPAGLARVLLLLHILLALVVVGFYVLGLVQLL